MDQVVYESVHLHGILDFATSKKGQDFDEDTMPRSYEQLQKHECLDRAFAVSTQVQIVMEPIV